MRVREVNLVIYSMVSISIMKTLTPRMSITRNGEKMIFRSRFVRCLCDVLEFDVLSIDSTLSVPLLKLVESTHACF